MPAPRGDLLAACCRMPLSALPAEFVRVLEDFLERTSPCDGTYDGTPLRTRIWTAILQSFGLLLRGSNGGTRRSCGSAALPKPPPPAVALPWDALPVELLGVVAAHVDTQAGPSALLSFARTSKSCMLAVDRAALVQLRQLKLEPGSWFVGAGKQRGCSSIFMRLLMVHRYQHRQLFGERARRIDALRGDFTAVHAAFLRWHGADEHLLSAALRLEVEVNVLLDALDDMGYLVETEAVEQRILQARSFERRQLVERMSSLRLHRDAVLTILGLDALAGARMVASELQMGLETGTGAKRQPTIDAWRKRFERRALSLLIQLYALLERSARGADSPQQ